MTGWGFLSGKPVRLVRKVATALRATLQGRGLGGYSSDDDDDLSVSEGQATFLMLSYLSVEMLAVSATLVGPRVLMLRLSHPFPERAPPLGRCLSPLLTSIIA